MWFLRHPVNPLSRIAQYLSNLAVQGDYSSDRLRAIQLCNTFINSIFSQFGSDIFDLEIKMQLGNAQAILIWEIASCWYTECRRESLLPVIISCFQTFRLLGIDECYNEYSLSFWGYLLSRKIPISRNNSKDVGITALVAIMNSDPSTHQSSSLLADDEHHFVITRASLSCLKSSFR